MNKKLGRKFYIQPALILAKELLGKYIVRKIGRGESIGKIVETEAYIGPKDKASHAYLGRRTPRNEAEYLVGGHIYIYLVYGMHWQFNISASKVGMAECVLIRAVEPVIESEKSMSRFKDLTKISNGPGKLCKYFKFDKSFYGEDLIDSGRIWLEDWGEIIDKKNIESGPRIGIDYAGLIWAKKPWRFWIKDSKFVSK